MRKLDKPSTLTPTSRYGHPVAATIGALVTLAGVFGVLEWAHVTADQAMETAGLVVAAAAGLMALVDRQWARDGARQLSEAVDEIKGDDPSA